MALTGTMLERLRAELAPTPRRPARSPLWRIEALVEAVEHHNLAEGPEVSPPANLIRLAEVLGADLSRNSHGLPPGGMVHNALLDLAERLTPACWWEDSE